MHVVYNLFACVILICRELFSLGHRTPAPAAGLERSTATLYFLTVVFQSLVGLKIKTHNEDQDVELIISLDR